MRKFANAKCKCKCSIPSFLIYEENFIILFISVGSLSLLLKCKDLRFSLESPGPEIGGCRGKRNET